MKRQHNESIISHILALFIIYLTTHKVFKMCVCGGVGVVSGSDFWLGCHWRLICKSDCFFFTRSNMKSLYTPRKRIIIAELVRLFWKHALSNHFGSHSEPSADQYYFPPAMFWLLGAVYHWWYYRPLHCFSGLHYSAVWRIWFLPHLFAVSF